MGDSIIFGQILSAGIEAQAGADGIRKHTRDLINQTTKMKTKWDSVFQKSGAIDTDLFNEIVAIKENMSKTTAQLKEADKQYQKNYRLIQMTGVIVIIVIFFLFVLKQFDLFEPIKDIFIWPFQTIYETLQGKK
jgi:hypothetical protein